MAVAQSMRTHCPQGHLYDESNTYRSSGRRICRRCMLDRAAAKRGPASTLAERVWSRIERCPDGCWRWTGNIAKATGYGTYNKALAHRLVYELLVGPIPDGLTIDHLCRVRHCVNPSHLEPVTLATNVLRGESLPARNARKDECPQGHPYDDENTYRSPTSGWRFCRACHRARAATARARR